MELIKPTDISLVSSSVSESAYTEYASETTYAIDDIVYVSFESDGMVAIEAITSATTPVFTWTGHNLSVGQKIMITAITQADWTVFNDTEWEVSTIPDTNTFTLVSAPDTSGFAAYDAGTDPGTFAKCRTPHEIYKSLADTNAGNYPPDNAAKWSLIGATNRWKMFDGFVNTQQRIRLLLSQK